MTPMFLNAPVTGRTFGETGDMGLPKNVFCEGFCGCQTARPHPG